MSLPLINPGDPLPAPQKAWGMNDPVPGLLAAGGSLDVSALLQAYAQGTFPWFSADQPILWWCPDPRMVLPVERFAMHRSLRKTLQHFRAQPDCEIRVDHGFEAVISACAQAPRSLQHGTWIVPEMVQAYCKLHRAGHAHSFETWIDGELAGGLYCVSLGQAIFGESMFTRRTDASKIALSALVAWCMHHAIAWIDCQQNTGHLASLGAVEMQRSQFLEHVAQAAGKEAPPWHFEPLYWQQLLPT